MINELPDFREEMRLADLYSFGILDTEEEEDFSQLVELAANITNCPMAAISFIDKDRQWFKAIKNMGVRETRRDEAFCHHTIQQDEVLMVSDAGTDIRFQNNPYVTGDPNISFYAGAPISSISGQKLGAVCVLDSANNRQLSKFQLESLQTIANQISRLLELKRKNKSLINYTNKLIEAEKALHRLSIKEEESERNFIANQLHENFAQTLAATKLYIEFAETEKDLAASFLAKSKDNIEHIINEIRLLCNYIKPVDNYQASPTLLINEYIKQWSLNSNVEVSYLMESEEELPSESGLFIYRLLQTVLPLTKTYRVRKLNLSIILGSDIEINVNYQPNSNYTVDPYQLLLLKKSISMAQAEGGQLLVTRTAEGAHQIMIHLPLPIQVAV
ncbi:GAF domain-containing protein [Flavihumibacter sp. UBA7668]|uniref:GAF domain-containing protein n=1 Tax=Flavihumibacter sp. UBA7668 TaxID=1946542 RepID=UPI0025B98D01|nr:GAF domain-containing protein [Flavihumibacter sp. UBA7668]